MKKIFTFALLSLALCCASTAEATTFGSGGNTFDIEFVPIGNPGNPADPDDGDSGLLGIQNFGSVAYNYRMGKFEISEDMIDKANTLGGLGIIKDTRGANKPATSVSWNQAARFVNWLNASTGNPLAYKFAFQPEEVDYSADAGIELWTSGDAGYDANNLYRNSLARYVLSSVDEWYKAAFYDPNGDVYYDYATGSDTLPTSVASGTDAGTAVWDQSGPADITQAGGLSPYGTMGQAGNVLEWEETDYDLVNDMPSGSTARGIRSGFWLGFPGTSSTRTNANPVNGLSGVGFRVASIPEPGTLLLGAMATAGIFMQRRHPS